MKYLLLWLEAPLQSWGYESKFDLRTTFSFPTMSGVYGIVLASSGDSGPQTELLARMWNAFFEAVEFQNSSKKASLLCDYQMVGNGYNDKDAWESLHIPRTSEGKKAVSAGSGYGGTKQTYRYYLQDKKFAVILGLEADLTDKFSRSLEEPVYDLYLGRKCCVPTDKIFQGRFETKADAEKKMEEIAAKKEVRMGRRLVTVTPEALSEDGFFLSDVPPAFGEQKRYAQRCVKFVEETQPSPS